MILRVVDVFYTSETDGYRETMPVLHVFGRDTSFNRHHVRVDGFRPYFVVRQSEWAVKGEEVAEDDRIVDVQTTDLRGRPERTLDGEPAIRVVCREPSDVGDLRELFDDPHEADVLFPTRFLLDHEVDQWMEVPDEAIGSDEAIHHEHVSIGVDPSKIPPRTPPLRVATYDLEVEQGGGGPPVVSTRGTERASNAITAISAHDSYTDEYVVWVLAHSDWEPEDYETAKNAVDAEVKVYDLETNVPSAFISWLTERDFDAMTGWNASGFDHPYLVNYCLNHDVYSIYDLSPTRDVRPMDGDGSWINSSLKGRLLLDLKDMYSKTEIHELDSYRLEAVADEEDVSVGKLSIEEVLDVPNDEPAIDYARRVAPDVFTEYALRDTQAAVGINEESKKDAQIV